MKYRCFFLFFSTFSDTALSLSLSLVTTFLGLICVVAARTYLSNRFQMKRKFSVGKCFEHCTRL